MATSYASLLAARIKVWDLPLRVCHWLLVTAIVLAFLSSEEGSALNQWHILAGWVAGILIAFRLIWGLCRRRAQPLCRFRETGGDRPSHPRIAAWTPQADCGSQCFGWV